MFTFFPGKSKKRFKRISLCSEQSTEIEIADFVNFTLLGTYRMYNVVKLFNYNIGVLIRLSIQFDIKCNIKMILFYGNSIKGD